MEAKDSQLMQRCSMLQSQGNDLIWSVRRPWVGITCLENDAELDDYALGLLEVLVNFGLRLPCKMNYLEMYLIPIPSIHWNSSWKALQMTKILRDIP